MSRLGTRDMELAVWELPREGQDRKEFPAMLSACETLWREHLLSKIAIPEVCTKLFFIYSNKD